VRNLRVGHFRFRAAPAGRARAGTALQHIQQQPRRAVLVQPQVHRGALLLQVAGGRVEVNVAEEVDVGRALLEIARQPAGGERLEGLAIRYIESQGASWFHGHLFVSPQ
jgi:hypothetical protein